MTRAQLRRQAYRVARDAGLDTNTADACARRVVEAITDRFNIRSVTWISMPRELLHLIADEVQRHAQP